MKVLLEERRENLLLAIHGTSDEYGLASLELSSGRFVVQEIRGQDALTAELERLQPAEILVSEDSPCDGARAVWSSPSPALAF